MAMLSAYPNSSISRGLLWIFSSCVLSFLMLPTLIVVPLSFSDSNLMEFPPSSFSLRWYYTFFESSAWMGALKTSLILGVLTALIAVPAGLLVSLAINRLGGRTGSALYGTVLAPSVVPGILLAIGLFFVLARLGLIGTIVGVLVGHVVLAIPVVTIILLPAIHRFEWDQIQAARSLGSNWARAVVGIAIPQLLFSISAAGLMAFLTSLDEAIISVFVSSGDNTTLPKMMFQSLRDQIDPTIAAISTLWTLFVIFAVLLVNRRSTN